MKAKLIVAAFTFVTGTSMFALAGEGEKHVNVFHTEGASTIMVNIEKEDDGNAIVDLKINGEEYSFELPELEAGETREITTNDGKVIKLIKLEKGTSVDIDGKNIMLHSLDGSHAMAGGDHGRMAKVFAFGGMGGMSAAHDDNSIVITASGLDDDARARIKDAIASVGIDKKIIFSETKMLWLGNDGSSENIEVIIDGDGNKNERVIKIMKKLHIETEEDDS